MACKCTYNVVVKETQLTLEPKGTWVFRHPAFLVGLIEFHEQLLVPFSVNMPVLHGVGHIRCLDNVLNYNGCPQIIVFLMGDGIS